MIEFTVFDFVLISSTVYLLGVLTGLMVCCKNKETFLQRERSIEDLSRLNHQNNIYPPEAQVITQPSAPTFSEITLK